MKSANHGPSSMAMEFFDGQALQHLIFRCSVSDPGPDSGMEIAEALDADVDAEGEWGAESAWPARLLPAMA